MNTQEAFNIIWERAKIKKKAINEVDYTRPGCKYRADNGLACFIGVLFPDECYRPELEGQSINALLESNELPSVLDSIDESFLILAQPIHDVDPVEDWEENLRALASDFNLTIPGEC